MPRIITLYFRYSPLHPFCIKKTTVLETSKRPHPSLGARITMNAMERKIFWISFTVLGILADVVLPLWWALAATIPVGYVSWWIAYRSGWFE